MHKIEPIELIETPLVTGTADSRNSPVVPVSVAPSSALLLQKRTRGVNNSVGGRKRHSLGLPQGTPVSDDLNCTQPLLPQSQSHHLIGRDEGGGPEVLSTRNRHSSGCLPSEPLLTAVNINVNPMQTALPLSNRTLQVRLEDDGYCSSFTSKNSEGAQHGGLTTGSGPVKPTLNHDHPSTPSSTRSHGDPDRETWGQSLDFLLSIIGFAVDLANVWRFPYYCYKNGGGAFLIPYFLMLLFSAIPVFYMELLLGQSIRQGPISMWRICPLFKGIGYCAVTVSYFVSWYYNTIMGWSLHYTINSFASPLPWTTCNNSWNTENCYIPVDNSSENEYGSNETRWGNSSRPSNATSPASEYFRNSVLEMGNHDIDNLGTPKTDLLICVAIIYCLLYVIIFRGIRSSGKVVWVTATLPYVVMAILLVRGLFLEGAIDGIYYYLVPNMTKLYEVEVWSDAAKQIFFSSGAGFGVHLTYASYNNFHNNCYRDCLVTSMVNCFTSIFSGFVIFTFLGSMATRQRRPISEVVNIGPGLVFEVYPEAVGTLPGANFWSMLFFIMLIMLGIDSAMGGLECVITGITDEFKPWFRRKKHAKEWFKFGVVLVSFLISIINITRGGMYTFTFLDTYAAGSSLLLAVLFEILAVSWVYGLDQLCKDAEAMLGSAPGIFWRICWKFISPMLIAIIIILDFSTSLPLKYDEYTFPDWAQVFGIIFTFIPITLVPIIGLTELLKFPGSCKMKLGYAITPMSEHGVIKERGYIKRFKWPHWLYIR